MDFAVPQSPLTDPASPTARCSGNGPTPTGLDAKGWQVHRHLRRPSSRREAPATIRRWLRPLRIGIKIQPGARNSATGMGRRGLTT